MKDKFFLDTNILIYSFDSPKSEKRIISRQLIRNAHLGKGCISFQVIQEFLNTATRKFTVPLKKDDAQSYLSKVMFPICEVFPSEQLYSDALGIFERWKFSFYDSLIIAAAIEAKCKILFSEDLQHKQKIYELTVINPFAK